MSLRARLGLAAGVAVALAVVAVAVSAYAGTRSELTSQLDNSLEQLATKVLANPGGPGGAVPGAPGSGYAPQPGYAGQSGFPGASGGGGAFENGFSDRDGIGHEDEGLGLDGNRGGPYGGAPGILMLVYRDGGSWVPATQGYSLPIGASAKALAKRGTGQYFTDLTVGSSHTHVRVLAKGIGAYGALLVALPLTEVDNTLSSLLLLMLVIAASGIALAALLGLLVARTALAPIARFTAQTESIAASPQALEYERVDVSGGDELARLARTFNTTLDALQQSVEAQRNLVADASHELRTPIATIRANLQLIRDERLLSQEDREALRIDMIDELDELTRLVGDVVELARGAQPAGEHGEVRLDQIVGEALERARRRAPGLTFQDELEPTLVIGEGDRIARAVTNLLDNASKWSPSGGTVEVGLHGGVISVRDHGPGFHERDLPFVFDGTLARSPARGSGSRSCARPPRRTAASPRPRTRPTEGRCCGSASGRRWRLPSRCRRPEQVRAGTLTAALWRMPGDELHDRVRPSADPRGRRFRRRAAGDRACGTRRGLRAARRAHGGSDGGAAVPSAPGGVRPAEAHAQRVRGALRAARA
jgi:two-component system, OmpR family, sensor histidine kinase MprB